MMLGKDEIKTIDQDTSLSDTIYVLRLKTFLQTKHQRHATI